jgi:hypothetical protein
MIIPRRHIGGRVNSRNGLVKGACFFSCGHGTVSRRSGQDGGFHVNLWCVLYRKIGEVDARKGVRGILAEWSSDHGPRWQGQLPSEVREWSREICRSPKMIGKCLRFKPTLFGSSCTAPVNRCQSSATDRAVANQSPRFYFLGSDPKYCRLSAGMALHPTLM